MEHLKPQVPHSLPIVRLFAIFLLGCMAAFVSSSSVLSAPLPPIIVFGQQVPMTLDPRDANDELVKAYIWNIFDRLVDDRMRPEISSSWQTSGGEKSHTFTLRGNMAFTDGEPLTADSLVYTLKSIQDPAQRFKLRTLQGLLSWRIMSQGPLHLQIDTPTSPAFFSLLSLLAAVPPGAGKRPDFGTHPVGSGPYVVEQFVPGEELDLVPNPHYKLKDPTNRVTIRAVPDENARIQALRDGQAQLGQLVQAQDVHDIAGVSVDSATLPTLIYLRLATRKGVFQDPAVRRAIAYSVSPRALVTVLPQGRIPATSMFFPTAIGYKEETFNYPYNIEQARTLLKEAPTFHPGTSFRLVVQQDLARATSIGEFVGGRLRAIGFDPTIVVLPAAEVFAEVMRGTADGYVGANHNPGFDPVTALRPLSAQSSQVFYYARTAELLSGFATEAVTHQQANRFFQKIDVAVAADVPIIPLYWEVTNWASRGVQGLRIDRSGALLLRDLQRK